MRGTAQAARAPHIGLALDEGYAVLDGVIGGVRPPIAMIGVAEKGYVSVELAATGAAATAPSRRPTMPPFALPAPSTAGGKPDAGADRGTDRSDARRHRALRRLGPCGLALANRWLTGSLVKRQLLAAPEHGSNDPDDARRRRSSTQGPRTMILPQFAHAVVNHRILPVTRSTALSSTTAA